MNTLSECLLTASIMLTVSWAIAAMLLRRVAVRTPRLRQIVLVGVLLQGLMLFRLPIELPWLRADPPAVAQTIDVADLETPTDVNEVDESLPMFALPGDMDATTPAIASLPVTATESLSTSEMLFSAAIATWIVGFLAVISIGVFRYLRVCRLLGRLQPAAADWYDQWDEICHEHSRPAPVMLESQTAGPMLVRRPHGYALVVPKDFWASLSDDQRRGILLHEFAHLRRRDVWRQLFVRLCASLHWWNPAAWWCVRRYEESAEWACDEMLTQCDRRAARGLASSLIHLLEFLESNDSKAKPELVRGVGVQSMAAPPLTERVSRLLHPQPSGDSMMKRLLLGTLAVGLLTVSAVQFRLVAAPPQEEAAGQDAFESDLEVLSPEAKYQIGLLADRLDTSDPATGTLAELLKTDAGQIAVVGMVDHLEHRERESARADAMPRFIAKHFAEDADGKLSVRPEAASIAKSWVDRGKKFGNAFDSLSSKLQSIADRLEDKGETNEIAKRMLSDPHAGLALMMIEFEGRIDPIDRFLDEAMGRLLVQRGDRMIVIPNLGGEARGQLERFSIANEIFERLRPELPLFAEEFATPDEPHRGLVAAMKKPEMAAVLAIMTSDDIRNPAAAVDHIFERIEEACRESSKGLVIAQDEAWEHIDEMTDAAERSAKRVEEVQNRLDKIAAKMDLSDAKSANFAKQVSRESAGSLPKAIAYHVAAEIPYAEFDLAEMVESMLSEAMQPAGDGKMRIRDEISEEVNERAREILSASRKIRRYMRQVDGFVERIGDRAFAQSLTDSAKMVILNDIRNSAEESGIDTMALLQKEVFESGSGDRLRVRPDREELVRELAERAEELRQELAQDDF